MLDKVMNWLQQSPEGKTLAQRACAEEAEAILARRRTLVREKRNLEATALAQAHTHEEALARATAILREREAAVEESRQDVRALVNQHALTQLDTNQVIRRIDTELFQTRPQERLEAARQQIAAEIENARNQLRVVNGKDVEGRQRPLWSNTASVNARIAALFRAADGVAALSYEALTADELETRVAALLDAIPAIETEPPASLMDRLIHRAQLAYELGARV